MVKRDYLPHELGETTVDAMRRVSYRRPHFRVRIPDVKKLTLSLQMKHAFDPLCLLNCDKIMRMQKPAKGEVEEW